MSGLTVLPSRGHRRGQSEVIGGLIVLTLLFIFAVPLILNTYYAVIRSGEEARASLTQEKASFNEKLSIGPVNVESDIAQQEGQQEGWIPGVWINNTGTVSVTLDKLYLVNTYNSSIYKIYDLKYARPNNPPDIVMMLLVKYDEKGNIVKNTPPRQKITLQPGETLLIVFNDTFKTIGAYLIPLVESESGLLHPLGGISGSLTLYPASSGQSVNVNITWNGTFNPVYIPTGGFILRGYNDLTGNGNYTVWRPPLTVQSTKQDCSPTYIQLDATPLIYNDPQYKGLYRVEIRSISNDNSDLCVNTQLNTQHINLGKGNTLILKGYIGSFATTKESTGSYRIYVSGYAYEVEVLPSKPDGKIVESTIVSLQAYNNNGRTDFDGNAVDELAFYSIYKPGIMAPADDVDGDGDGKAWRDSLIFTYTVNRSISGVDYIRVNVKLAYYWAWTGSTTSSTPSLDANRLKIFSIVLWRYDNNSNTWIVDQLQDYYFTTDSPKIYYESAIFPVSRSGVYRAGIIIYDSYRDWEGLYSSNPYEGLGLDFYTSLEYVIVEYGLYNPNITATPQR